MSFLLVWALGVGLLVIVPLVAHLLRRSRAARVEFPPAGLVPRLSAVARRPGQLEDRWVFALRALLIVALAVLGATPLLRCSRLELGRTRGASVAVAIVLDDSLSMQSLIAHGASRWERARARARDLVGTARDGDAFAIVLAGRPARLALGMTADLSVVRRTLAQLGPSDRSTDLEGAVGLARASLAGLPQVDRRVLLLSDLGGKPPVPGDPPVLAPLPELRMAVSDCGVISAEQQAKQVVAAVACTDSAAARGRKVELATDHSKQVIAARTIAPRGGRQTVIIEAETIPRPASVRLTGTDALARDDRAALSGEETAELVGVVADPARASVATGGPTVIEQALTALASRFGLRPFTTVPDEERELDHLRALVVDDPGGLTPETRSALGVWLGRGGVALGLLGPASESGELGLSLEPFAEGSVHWEATENSGLDPKSVAWLGEEAQGLDRLAARGRAALESAEPRGARIVGRWSDGRAWLFEREVGRGLVLTAGLPAAIGVSDLALRPGFLALLDHLLDEAVRRRGPPESPVGSLWSFPAAARVEVNGPDGPVPLAATPGGEQSVALGAAGRYEVRVDGQVESRVVRWEANEILDPSFDPGRATPGIVMGGTAEHVDVSREAALAVLLLLGLEVALRAWALGRAGRGILRSRWGLGIRSRDR
jgi:hypothetical protein